jgi:predicted DNA-binding helix-hairpin-helix protein
MPVNSGSNLPALDSKPQLLREHRLYQADWLLRFYGFESSELLDEKNPNFNLLIDPKCNWALNHYDFFPVEINTVPYDTLLRVPGLGVISARKIVKARKMGSLDFTDLKKMGVSLKRSQFFITCRGNTFTGIPNHPETVLRGLISEQSWELAPQSMDQLSLFDNSLSTREDLVKCLTGQM